MSTGRTDTPLLVALLTATGVAVGAGIYESRVVIPRWSSRATPEDIGPALNSSGHMLSGQAFWPLVAAPAVPLAAANTVQALRSSGRRRPWWFAFSATMATTCVATAAYFVPELHRLSRAGDLSEAEVARRASRRVRLDNVRLAVLVSAWLLGLTALSQPS
jgi:hypothetical protein